MESITPSSYYRDDSLNVKLSGCVKEPKLFSSLVPMALDLQSIETGLQETTISKIDEVLAPYLKYFDEDHWLDAVVKGEDVSSQIFIISK